MQRLAQPSLADALAFMDGVVAARPEWTELRNNWAVVRQSFGAAAPAAGGDAGSEVVFVVPAGPMYPVMEAAVSVAAKGLRARGVFVSDVPISIDGDLSTVRGRTVAFTLFFSTPRSQTATVVNERIAKLRAAGAAHLIFLRIGGQELAEPAYDVSADRIVDGIYQIWDSSAAGVAGVLAESSFGQRVAEAYQRALTQRLGAPICSACPEPAGFRVPSLGDAPVCSSECRAALLGRK